jgi:hypothetical protein
MTDPREIWLGPICGISRDWHDNPKPFGGQCVQYIRADIVEEKAQAVAREFVKDIVDSIYKGHVFEERDMTLARVKNLVETIKKMKHRDGKSGEFAWNDRRAP